MQNKKMLLTMLSFLLIFMTLAGCGSKTAWNADGSVNNESIINNSVAGKIEDEPKASYPGAGNLIVVGVSQVGSESVWRTANTESLQKTFTKENGYFLLFDNARQKQENQIKALRSFISQRVDYIILSPITETGWDTVFEEARDAGIPIILIDRQADVSNQSLYTAWVGSDFRWEGQQAGEVLEKTLEDQGRAEEKIRIVSLCGTEGATATIGRTKGFAEVADKHANWEMLEEVDADFTTTKGKEVMRDLLKKYEDIDVVISQNDDMTFGAMEALKDAGLTTGPDGEVQVISYDATPNGLALVRDGKITADVQCNSQQGPYVERIIQNLEHGFKIQKDQYVEEQVFTRENANISDTIEEAE